MSLSDSREENYCRKCSKIIYLSSGQVYIPRLGWSQLLLVPAMQIIIWPFRVCIYIPPTFVLCGKQGDGAPTTATLRTSEWLALDIACCPFWPPYVACSLSNCPGYGSCRWYDCSPFLPRYMFHEPYLALLLGRAMQTLRPLWLRLTSAPFLPTE